MVLQPHPMHSFEAGITITCAFRIARLIAITHDQPVTSHFVGILFGDSDIELIPDAIKHIADSDPPRVFRTNNDLPRELCMHDLHFLKCGCSSQLVELFAVIAIVEVGHRFDGDVNERFIEAIRLRETFGF